MLPDELQQGAKIVREFHHPIFDLYKRDDGIIVRVSKDNAQYTLPDTHEYVKALHDLTNGAPHFLLLVPGKNSSMDSASRSYLAGDEALKDIKAMSGVLKTVGHRLIGNLYLNYNKPKIPVRFFDTYDEAINWLKNLRSSNAA